MQIHLYRFILEYCVCSNPELFFSPKPDKHLHSSLPENEYAYPLIMATPQISSTTVPNSTVL